MRATAIFLAAILLAPCLAQADVAPYMSYQGVLRDDAGSAVPDGDYSIAFRIYDVETGGTILWEETQSVSVTGGVFDVLLGTTVPLNTLGFDVPYWLGIDVAGEGELVPRTPFATVPYAAHAGFADTVLDADDDWHIDGDDISHTGGTTSVTGDMAVYRTDTGIGTALSVSNATHLSNSYAIHAVVTSDMAGGHPRAVHGESVPADGYGIGGSFEGGSVGVRGDVYPEYGNTYKAVVANCNGGYGTNYGLWARALGTGTNYAVYADANNVATSYAGWFVGNLHFTQTLTGGLKSFKIDHPLDPANKYLQHACIESDEILNLYNGNVTLDGSGEAWVTMPDWFEALNQDFRYQLTCIGGHAPVYIAEEIRGNRFRIAGGEPGMKVSWQVSGVRHDPFVERSGYQVEYAKPADEVGKYMHPEAYGLPMEMGVGYRAGDEPAEEMER